MSGRREAGSGLFQLGGIPRRGGCERPEPLLLAPSPSGGKPPTDPSTQPPRADALPRLPEAGRERRVPLLGRCLSPRGSDSALPGDPGGPRGSLSRLRMGSRPPPQGRDQWALGGAGSATGPPHPPAGQKWCAPNPASPSTASPGARWRSEKERRGSGAPSHASDWPPGYTWLQGSWTQMG